MSLRNDALAIWKAGVAAVDSSRLVRNAVHVDDETLRVDDFVVSLSEIDHVQVLGAGKAGTGMVRGLLTALAVLPKRISIGGWVNVPADCVEECPDVRLHAARPAGVNEPTTEAVAGTQEILRRIRKLGRRDLCILLISGGGSALLPAPVAGISLADKLSVTRLLAGAGATIQELNIVRSQLSDVKGGRLLHGVRSANVVALIVSDIVGDPVELIASGPTLPSRHQPSDAVQVLQHYCPNAELVPASVGRHLHKSEVYTPTEVATCHNVLVGSNRVALLAAAAEAKERGYRVVDLGSDNAGDATDHGHMLYDRLHQLRAEAVEGGGPICVLAGGETTVTLAKTEQRRRGGRNQEVILSAIDAHPQAADWQNLCLLSGGTDGEDGPTDAAGALADQDLLSAMAVAQISPESYLQINNSYPFFQQLGGLIQTGPTHTNVMDLAVGLVRSRG